MFAMTQAMHEAEPVPWAPDDSSFGARLALVRQRMHWNTAEAARACGLNPDSWRLWEEGRRPRDFEVAAKRIAHRTGCDLRWLTLGPSRTMLAARAQVTACYDRWPDMPAMPTRAPVADYDPQSGPVERLPLTRAVERTRPVRRPERSVSQLVTV